MTTWSEDWAAPEQRLDGDRGAPTEKRGDHAARQRVRALGPGGPQRASRRRPDAHGRGGARRRPPAHALQSWPRPSRSGLVVALVLAAIAAVAGLDGAWPAGGLLAVGALVVLLRIAQECAAGLGHPDGGATDDRRGRGSPCEADPSLHQPHAVPPPVRRDAGRAQADARAPRRRAPGHSRGAAQPRAADDRGRQRDRVEQLPGFLDTILPGFITSLGPGHPRLRRLPPGVRGAADAASGVGLVRAQHGHRRAADPRVPRAALPPRAAALAALPRSARTPPTRSTASSTTPRRCSTSPRRPSPSYRRRSRSPRCCTSPRRSTGSSPSWPSGSSRCCSCSSACTRSAFGLATPSSRSWRAARWASCRRC